MRADELASRTRARRVGDHWVTHCPAHQDRTPSLDFTDGQHGILVYCRSRGCHIQAICRGWGLRPSELFFNQRSREVWHARWAQPATPKVKWWREPTLSSLHYAVAETARYLSRLGEQAQANAQAYGDHAEGWQWAGFQAALDTEAERLMTSVDWASLTKRVPAEED